MQKQYVFLAHGMGTHANDKWAEAFKTSILKSLKNYEPFATQTDDEISSEWIKFVPLSYDNLIEEFRKRWKKSADDVAGPLGKQWSAGKKILDVFSNSSDAAGKEDIFWSHLLDPLLWVTLPDARKAIIGQVSEQICAGLEEMYGDVKANSSHIIAHSLGSSVVHDCLASLRYQSRTFSAFATGSHRWKTVVMLANVSRLLRAPFRVDAKKPASAYDPYRSPLTAGFADSACDNFINAHHRIDPFTWPLQFRPKWPPQAYTDIQTLEFKDPTTVHDFELYFENPYVHVPVIWAMFGDFNMCTDAEVRAASDKFKIEHPYSASSEFEHLRGLFGADPNQEVDVMRLAEYLYRTYQELRP